MKKNNSELVADVPDQTFFEFAEALALDEARRRDRAGSDSCIAKTTRPTGFITEARAAELFLAAARARRARSVNGARVVFKPFRATLYSFKIRPDGVASVTLHVAFRQAPEIVLTQAAQLMFTRRRARRRELPRAEYDAFVRGMAPADFELPGARRGRQLSFRGPGEHRSLEECFQRVNETYFQSRLEQPDLCWSPARARRILGSYQERNDRVIVSRLFDSPKVPLYVLDYLMFHELLHKFLGIGRRHDGKRCMHGREFRELERTFQHYREATAFIKRMR